MKTKHKQLIKMNTTVRTASVSSNWEDQRLIPVLTVFIEVLFWEFLDIFGADPLKYSRRWCIFASWGQILFWERAKSQWKQSHPSDHWLFTLPIKIKAQLWAQHGTLMLLCKFPLAMKTISDESFGHQTLWLDS